MSFKDFIAMLAVSARAQHEAKTKLRKTAKPMTSKQAQAVERQKGNASKRAKRSEN